MRISFSIARGACEKLKRVFLPKMQNEAGEVVDTYIPRKCNYTQRIINAKDHASVQINIGDVDEKTGRLTGGFKPYALSGFLRRSGESDDALNHLTNKDGISVGLVENRSEKRSFIH